MPIYKEQQKQFYSTRAEVLKIFRAEEKLKCHCVTEIWAEQEQKRFCYNSARKWNLSAELKKKLFWDDYKDLKYWKVHRQGRYKELKIAPVLLKPTFVGTVTIPEEMMQELHL